MFSCCTGDKINSDLKIILDKIWERMEQIEENRKLVKCL